MLEAISYELEAPRCQEVLAAELWKEVEEAEAG